MEKAGLDAKRLQLVWISASEGEIFAQKIREVKEKIIDQLDKEEIEKAKEFFVSKEKKKRRKKEKISA